MEMTKTQKIFLFLTKPPGAQDMKKSNQRLISENSFNRWNNAEETQKLLSDLLKK